VVEITVTITGDDEMGKAVQNALSQFGPEMLGVIVEEAEDIITASKEIVPVDDVVLKPTGGLYGTEESPEGVSVLLGYGGAASAYAKDQHETPPNVYSHAEGKTWKYLQTPFLAALESMGARFASKLASRISSKFSGGGGGSGGGSGGTFGGR